MATTAPTGNQPVVTLTSYPSSVWHPAFGPPIDINDYRAYVAGDHQRRRDGGKAGAPPEEADLLNQQNSLKLENANSTSTASNPMASPLPTTTEANNNRLAPSPSAVLNQKKFFSLSEIISQNKARARDRCNSEGGKKELLVVGDVAIQNEEWDDFYGPPVRKRVFADDPNKNNQTNQKPRDRFAWKNHTGDIQMVPTVPSWGSPTQPLQPQQQYVPPYMQQTYMMQNQQQQQQQTHLSLQQLQMVQAEMHKLTPLQQQMMQRHMQSLPLEQQQQLGYQHTQQQQQQQQVPYYPQQQQQQLQQPTATYPPFPDHQQQGVATPNVLADQEVSQQNTTPPPPARATSEFASDFAAKHTEGADNGKVSLAMATPAARKSDYSSAGGSPSNHTPYSIPHPNEVTGSPPRE